MTNALILNVDDREVSRYIRSSALREAGYTVIEAETGAEALARVAADQPQLVLLDVHLPDMSGFEVCRRIKESYSERSPLVLHISSSAIETEDQIEGFSGGADAYLVEPVDPELLRATARAFLRLRQAEDDLRSEIEKRKRAEEALLRSNQDLQQFAYIASHDLQEPLRAVASFAQLFVRKYKDQLGNEADEYLSYIIGGVSRMKDMINDLLALSRASDNDLTRAKPTDANEIVRTAMANLATAIQESGAEIHYEKLPVVLADSFSLVQVFQNLIGNAIKYRSFSAPQIYIKAMLEKSEWIFSVQDNGVGFSQKNADAIFEVFRRLHGRDIPGTGIGLALCKKIIERRGGRIWAVSEVDRGATFYFTVGI